MADLNSTPSGERIHIGFFGLRNAGKSSLVNAVTGQDLAVVSPVQGTTTDLVSKAMELLPLGPVVIVDTPGFDDVGELGELRVQRTKQALRKCDIAVLVTEVGRDLQPTEKQLLELFAERNIPFVVALNKVDLLDDKARLALTLDENQLATSATEGINIYELKELIGHLSAASKKEKRVVADLIEPGDLVVLVIPIDSSAPKGRIILPQQMVLRDILDAHASAVCCQPEELADVLASIRKPKLVITDSQVFGQVSAVVPEDIWLTSFSILLARYKGSLESFVRGAAELSRLKDGDKVVVSEGCSHHRQCEDIGTVKIPRWLKGFSGAQPDFDYTSGVEFPENLDDTQLVLHCGGCMLNDKEMAHRVQKAADAGVPIVNYGIAIAHMHGILKRSLEPFPQVAALIE